MGAAVAMTRLDLTAGELRRAARKEKNSTVARRILALALVLEGSDRKKAAESCGMDRQTLRDWVHRYNAEGLAGLGEGDCPGKTVAAAIAMGRMRISDFIVRCRLFSPRGDRI